MFRICRFLRDFIGLGNNKKLYRALWGYKIVNTLFSLFCTIDEQNVTNPIFATTSYESHQYNKKTFNNSLIRDIYKRKHIVYQKGEYFTKI